MSLEKGKGQVLVRYWSGIGQGKNRVRLSLSRTLNQDPFHGSSHCSVSLAQEEDRV
jgi:hypothetical protein